MEESLLAVDGVYITNVKDLVKIKKIDTDKGQMELYNITESCTQIVNIKNNRLIKKIR